jgi:soluble lytic murein transglycosylase-like protein
VVPARDRSPERYQRYDAHIKDAAAVYQVPVALIRAVMKVESDFDPKVVSCAGAMGLMQLMPGTQKQVGVDDVWDARQSVFGGAAYLRMMANAFSGDLSKTIAGYHAGPGAVQKFGGVPPYETTRMYVKMVRGEYERQRAREGSAVARALAVPGVAGRPGAAAPQAGAAAP